MQLEDFFKRQHQGIFLNIPDKEYREIPAVNASLLKKATPYEMKEFLESPSERKSCFSFGTMIHHAILEPHIFDNGEFEKHYRVWTETKGLDTKKAQEAMQEDARTFITPSMADDVKRARDSVYKHKEASYLLNLEGNSEVSGIIWDEDNWCNRKIRIDRLPNNESMPFFDIKTTNSDLSVNGFKRDVFKFGYDVQLAFYHDTLAMLEGKHRECVKIIAIRNEKPFITRVFDLTSGIPDNESILEAGRFKYAERLASFVIAHIQNQWEAYENEGSAILKFN